MFPLQTVRQIHFTTDMFLHFLATDTQAERHCRVNGGRTDEIMNVGWRTSKGLSSAALSPQMRQTETARDGSSV
jgi:hypothetical protein